MIPLLSDEIQVWQRTVQPPTTVDLRILSAEELDRSARYKHAADRERFLTGAVLLRRAVEVVSGKPAREIEVVRRCPDCSLPHGKAVVKVAGVQASVSHSNDLVVVALTSIAPVGIDIEFMSPRDFRSIDASTRGDGEPAAQSAQDFYRRWTRKEAVLKAAGTGLRVPMRDVWTVPNGGDGERASIVGGYVASVWSLDMPDGYAGAIAIEGENVFASVVRAGEFSNLASISAGYI